MKFARLLALTLVVSGTTRLAADEPAVDFATEIVPVLTKAGCNAGACHGAAAGRGGFHLSLLGTDPASDYNAIVHAYEGRRINLAHLEKSLLLAKPTGQLEHGGDVVLEGDDSGAARIMVWISGGAQRGGQRRLTHLEVSPKRQIFHEFPATVPVKVLARFDNGPPEDVTRWTVFTAADPGAVEIDEALVGRISRRGQHVVMARFLDRVVPMQWSVPLSDAAVDLSGEPRANFIDEEVLRALSDLRVPVSPAATDTEFLRRVSLDLTGRLPDPLAARAWLADDASDKRHRLVESLLASDAFADYWTLQFSRLLRMHSLPNEQQGLRAYAAWLRQEIGNGTGMDEWCRQLLTATGDSHMVGPANFGRMVTDARGHAELVGQFFMGMRLGCANCHNHPLDRWTQDDYHGLAAVFAKVERGRDVRLVSRGAVSNPRTGEPAVPRIPGERFLTDESDHRLAVADWLTSSENRYFAKATVNRLWRAMFGRGLVEPADDLRETNPATHPELLDRLADDFVAHGYSIQHTLRLIALSNTYGRGASVVDDNAHDQQFYSHAYRRALEPEVLADAIVDVTGVVDEFAGQLAGTRAVTIVDPLAPAPSLDVLGRCVRAEGCEETSNASAGLSVQLHLLNGELINRKLIDPSSRLQQLIRAGQSNAEIVKDFYQRGLGRQPTEDERARWHDRLETTDPDERRARLVDFVWSLLNNRSFRENH